VEINKDMITYTWEFPRFQAHPELNSMSNVVYNIEYILSATDSEGHGSQVFGNVGISEPDPNSFKPFNYLTQSVVQSWVESALGEEVVTDLKDKLAEQISQQIAPPVVTLNKPW
jgi:hypothetical protein